MSLSFNFQRPVHAGPPPADSETLFDFSSMLSIERIRDHTKIADIPTVTHEQIDLYRAASIEAAQHYSGLLLDRQKTFIEPVIQRSRREFQQNYKTTYRHTLKHPSADGKIWLYGHNSAPILLQVAPGSMAVNVPYLYDVNLLSFNCCDPCAKSNDSGLHIMYVAGFRSVDDVPAGIILGCLKYISWCVTHPGDEYLSVRNRAERGSGTVTGTNNAAWASGALELWRAYDSSAI